MGSRQFTLTIDKNEVMDRKVLHAVHDVENSWITRMADSISVGLYGTCTSGTENFKVRGAGDAEHAATLGSATQLIICEQVHENMIHSQGGQLFQLTQSSR